MAWKFRIGPTDVAADAAQFMHDRHADLAEMLGIADAGQLQDMRRANRVTSSPLLPLLC
jgi:hypothetical protein